MTDETNAGGLTDAERRIGRTRYIWGEPEVIFSEANVKRIVAERVRVAVEQERAARLALVAGIEALADEWKHDAGADTDDMAAWLADSTPAQRTLAEAADDLRTTIERNR